MQSESGSDTEAQRRQAALNVAAGAAATDATAPNVGGAVEAAATAAAIAALVAFLVEQRKRSRTFLVRQLGAVARGRVAPNEIERLIGEEELRDHVFAERQAERLTRDLTAALTITDPAQRRARVQAIMRGEQRYAQMRSEAMAARAFAGVDRVLLRQTSPQGAYWRLGQAQNHTEGCLRMQGRFWPWPVLDRVHPPRHPGCTSSLHSYGEAVKNGWLQPGDVLNVRDAIRAAADVVMEFDERAAEGMHRELQLLELREVLIERHLTTPDQFDRVAVLTRRGA